MSHATEIRINNLLSFLNSASNDYSHESLLDIAGTFYSHEDIKAAKQLLSDDLKHDVIWRRDPDKKIKDLQDLLELNEEFMKGKLKIKYTSDNYKKVPPLGLEFIAPMLVSLNDELSKLNTVLPKILDIKSVVSGTADTVRQLRIDITRIDSKFSEAISGLVHATDTFTEEEENILKDLKSFRSSVTLPPSPSLPLQRDFIPSNPSSASKTLSYSEVVKTSPIKSDQNRDITRNIVNRANRGRMLAKRPNTYASEAFSGSNQLRRSRVNSSSGDNNLDSVIDNNHRQDSRTEVNDWTYVDSRRRREGNYNNNYRRKDLVYGTRKDIIQGFRAAPKYSHLFIGRVDKNVSMDEIKMYVENNFNIRVDAIENLIIKTDNYNAYKVSVLSNVFDKLLDSSLWPENIVVYKFFNKRYSYTRVE